MLKLNERIAAIVAEWRTRVGGADAAQFAEFDKRIRQNFFVALRTSPLSRREDVQAA